MEFSASVILKIILIILVAQTTLEWALEWLNIRAQRKELPEAVAGFYDADKYKQALTYQNTNTRFGWMQSIFSLALTLIVLLSGLLGWWNDFLYPYTDQYILHALLFFGTLLLASDIITIPFQWYHTFVIEEEFGFNKMTFKTFVADKLKGYLLAGIIGGGILALLLWLVHSLGANFWWWFWLAITLFMLVTNIFYTSWILPLFNKLTPLEEGSLRDKIESYCASVGFPVQHIYVMDGSKRSNKANAFFSGLGKKKKIVLFDTLISDHTEEELTAVLAHEAGHYKKKHIISSLMAGIFTTGITLFILSRVIFAPELSQALGAKDLSISLNLIAFALLYSPISTITGLIMNSVSRKNEFEADEFAAKTYNGKALQEALKKLSVKNLSNLFPHKAYVFFHYSHPPLLKRLEAIEKYHVNSNSKG